MQREVGAEGIRRGPTEVLADVLRPRGEDLRDERDADERERERRQRLERGAADRAVDERAQQLRAEELQADAGEDQGGEQRRAAPLPRDVAAEQHDVGIAGSHLPEFLMRPWPLRAECDVRY